jgi:hypothetical protein
VTEGVTSRLLAAVILAGAFVLAGAEAGAAPQPAAPSSKPETPSSNANQGEGTKPDESAPAPTGTSDTPLPETKPVPLGELTKEGFEIRSADFVPADAVTRQSGKVSSDAIVVTLQKSNATAICFYTLKAYVSKKLPTIPACTVHR